MNFNIFSKKDNDKSKETAVTQLTTEQTETNLLGMNVNSLVEMVKENPNLIREFIEQVDRSLKEHRANVESIKGRNFFKKLVSSNTKDLAEALMEESNILSSFFTFLQLLSFLCQGNAVLSYKILESLSKNTKEGEKASNDLYDMAHAYISEAIESANNEKIREDAIKRILINVITLNQWHKEDESHKARTEDRLSILENGFSTIQQHEIPRLDTSIRQLEQAVNVIKNDVENLKKRTWLDSQPIKLLTLVIATLGFVISMCALILS